MIESVHPVEEERLFSGYTGRLLASTSFGNATVLTAMLLLPPLLPTIIEHLGISSFLAGVGLSVMWGLAALLQYPGGRASDQLSRKTVLVASLGTLLVGSVVLAQSFAYATFLLGAAALGISAGLYWPTMFALTADVFAERRGQAFGILAGSGDVGGVLATAIAGVVLGVAPWRAAFVPAILIAAIGLVSMHAFNAEPYVVGPVDLEVRRTLRHLLADPETRLSVAAFSLFFFVYQGVTSFLPTFLQVEKGLATTVASNAFAILFVGGIVVKPLAGRVGDRVGHALVAMLSSLVATVGLAVLLAAGAFPAVIAGVALLAAGIAGLWPTVIAYVMALFPDGSMGGDLGAFRTLGYGFGAVGSTYVGFVAERASYGLAFAGFGACLVGVIAITLALSSRY